MSGWLENGGSSPTGWSATAAAAAAAAAAEPVGNGAGDERRRQMGRHTRHVPRRQKGAAADWDRAGIARREQRRWGIDTDGVIEGNRMTRIVREPSGSVEAVVDGWDRPMDR